MSESWQRRLDIAMILLLIMAGLDLVITLKTGGVKVKIPNKAYEVAFDTRFSVVSYYPREISSDLKEVRLPKWLTRLIYLEVENAKELGASEVRGKIRNALNIV
jgi:hypothetical protein